MSEENLQRVMETIVPSLSEWGLRILAAIAILVIGRIIAGIIASGVRRALDRTRAEPALKGFVVSLVRILIVVFAVIAAVAKLGIQTASFVAILGAAGFAIGFALQGSLANFAAGIMILFFKPFRVGDLIESQGHLGVVDDIGLFVTTINTLDNQRVIIPNGAVTSNVITNVNGNGIRRVDLTAGISYADDMRKARKIMLGVLESHPRILKDPAPTVAVREMGDSSVNFVVRPWCKGEDYWDVWFDVTQSIKEQFDANGVTIPFPQRDVHLFQKAAG